MSLVILTIVLLSIVGTQANSPYSNPWFKDNRSVVVHLMEWRYDEIAKECEIFLGKYGFGAVQVSPVAECAVLPNRPWWERYQPITYQIAGRSGNEQQFAEMVHRCNKVGVRIYVDIVLNHMSMFNVAGKGTAGSEFNGKDFKYPFFSYNDFHSHDSQPKCNTDSLDISNYDDPDEARNCQLGGLRDLNQAKPYVQEKQAEFLNKLIDIGVAGFRSDASKHQWPKDIAAIQSRLHNLNTSYFAANSKPFFYHEYIGGDKIKATEYTPLGRVIEFKNFQNMGEVFRKKNNQKLKYLKNYGPGTGKDGWGLLPSDDSFIMVDSHDLQRGHTGTLDITITFFESTLLKMATAFMLAWPYSIPRIMSSYMWPRHIVEDKDHHLVDTNDWYGPPHDDKWDIVPVKRLDSLACDRQTWICEHRWRQIYNMVNFRNVAGFEPIGNWRDNDNNQIAFSRGSKAFIAINNDDKPLDWKAVQTGLPAGTYCDIILGNLIDNKCTNRTIVVNSKGEADIFVNNWPKVDDPIIATHIEAKLK
ncbi:alpha-amylase-like [Oppia nitens]|uniref:alpha-amylase-like n=1 Tax=Oppia nitens TaxID=1686743 RepID=UPI0023DCA0AF|nr:alpha-amylase-like [Oppia nitens]